MYNRDHPQAPLHSSEINILYITITITITMTITITILYYTTYPMALHFHRKALVACGPCYSRTLLITKLSLCNHWLMSCYTLLILLRVDAFMWYIVRICRSCCAGAGQDKILQQVFVDGAVQSPWCAGVNEIRCSSIKKLTVNTWA